MTVSLDKLLDVQLDFANAVFESSDLNWNQRKRTKNCSMTTELCMSVQNTLLSCLEEMLCCVLLEIGMELCGDRQVFLKLVAA